MPPRRILALVLAGGKGTRLYPLTAHHAKPALPFAGGYRIVDFVLSNLVNSKISPIYVLAEYQPRSLIAHLQRAWRLPCAKEGCLVDVLLPRTESTPGRFRGTADAVYQNLELIDRHRPDLVAVFAADHVYRMDVRQMEHFHAACNADITIAAVPVPLDKASSFGVMITDPDGRVREFQEKPERPAPIPARSSHAYVSMGNYLFQPQVLADVLRDANARGEHDFGRDLLPRLSHTHRAYAYDFAGNSVPGLQAYEERGYWRDVGTIEAYLAAQADVSGIQPRFQLRNPHWPIRGATGKLAATGREAGDRAPEAFFASAGSNSIEQQRGPEHSARSRQ